MLVLSVELAPKTKGVKGKKSKNELQPEPEMPAHSDIERHEEEESDDDEEAAINDEIVQFFEDRPYFYDIAHERWINKNLKEAELKVFAEIIGWAPAKVLRKWKNWRTDYGKLRRSEGKSGQWSVKYTNLQKWKLQRLAFLAPFILHMSGKGIEMGGGADDEASEQLQEVSSDEESLPAVPTSQDEIPIPGPSTSTSTKRKKTQKKSGGEVSTILSQLLEENRKKDAELSMKIDKSTEQPSERDTFAAWLGLVVHQVPNQQFRSFQTEVFGVSMRYLQSASTDAPRTTDHPCHVQAASSNSHFSPYLPQLQPLSSTTVSLDMSHSFSTLYLCSSLCSYIGPCPRRS